MAIPPQILNDMLDEMKTDGLVEIGGAVGGRHVEYSFVLTRRGNERAVEAMERSGYLGPAPVPFARYLEILDQQSVRQVQVTPEQVTEALSNLVFADELLESVGAAITSGRSMMLYGPSGNGKSSITTALRDMFSGSVLVPHSVEADGQVIRVYDERVHYRLDPADQAGPGTGSPILRSARPDARFVRCQRPIVMVSGELTLETLELQYSPASHFYSAPPQMQANGGVLVIDDLGRQSVRPEDLLNRWITPMQSGWDQLRLETGGTVSVPFDVMLTFSTNLQPHELGDEAFFRRIRHKVVVPNPTREEFIEILHRACADQSVAFDPEGAEYLLDVYGKSARDFRGCHPGDIVSNLVDLARFRSTAPALTVEEVQAAMASYFVDGDRDHVTALKTRNTDAGGANLSAFPEANGHA
jgi:predicted ATPase with chaperone activity